MIFASSATLPPPYRRNARAWLVAAKLLGVFFLILGAKFCVMRACSNPLPFFDQWNGEGSNLLQPWLYGTLRWSDLVAVHVQHRIALTRLLVLGLFQANGGQWDTQVEMIAAAVIHASVAVLLGGILIRRLGAAAADKILLALLLVFALPFDWENTLSGGFQSQFYFLLLLSVVTVWGLGSHRPRTAGWWTGVGAAALSWVSMASAPLTPLAVAFGLALRRARPGPGDLHPADAREDYVTIGTALGLFVAGSSLSIGVNPITHLQPKTLADFAEKFLGLLAWPNPTPWAAPLAFAPWTFLVARRILRPDRAAGAADAFLLPLGMFSVLQTLAIAFARNQFHGLLVSRYMDVFAVGAVVNAACLVQFAGEARGKRGRAWLAATGAGWFGMLCVGLAGLTTTNLDRDLPAIKAHNTAEDANVAAFVAHPDPAMLRGKDAFDYECDKPDLLTDLLQDKRVRDALPTRARLPLTLAPAQTAGTLRPLIDDKPSPTLSQAPVGWTLGLPPAGVRASVFRSQSLTSRLPWLEFTVRGEVGPQIRFGLVGERTGRTEWILPSEGTISGAWWTTQVRVPPEPFHVEAAVTPGADAGGLRFFYPREMGGLSVWVDPIFKAATGLTFAGAALWLAAGFAGTVGGNAPPPAPVAAAVSIPFVRRNVEEEESALTL